MSKLGIAHLVAPAPYGGLESVILNLAAGQASAGHSVSVIGVFSETPRDHPFWERLKQLEGVDVVPLVLPGRQYLAERRALGDILGRRQVDVLHTHGYRPDVNGAPVARARNLATVTTVHGFTGNGWRNRAYEWLQRRSFRRFDGVVAVSGQLEDELVRSGVPRNVVHCVPNAWAPTSELMERSEARALLGLPDDVPVIGWVGRMSPEKAPDVMFDAFSRMSDGRSLLSFIGDGAMRSSLEERAHQEGVACRVHWHGVVPDAGRCLAAFDAVVISSWTEGTPIVLFEAMSAGVPVVSTAVGGIPDVVPRGEAVLVDPGDVSGMASALESVVAGGPDVAARVRAARHRLSEAYGVEPWVRRYDDVYRSCLVG